MAPHAETEAGELRVTLGALGLAPCRVAMLFGVSQRSVRRWQDGGRRIPCGAGIVFRLLAAGAVSIGQVEQAATSTSVRANDAAEPELAPLRVEPWTEPSTMAPTAAAALVDSAPSTAERVFALSPRACRFPLGDPAQPGFRFCGDPVARRPYCEQHRNIAYRPAP
jgi:hypothetical protein